MEATLHRPDVEVLDRAELNDGKVLVAYSRTEAALTELRARLEGKTWDLATTAGNQAARAARKELVSLRSTLESKRRELKAPALEMGRLIDAEAKRIEGAILALESPIDAAIKADEARREEERRIAAEAEARRVAALRERLKFLTDAPARAVGKTAAELDRIIGTLELAPVNEATFAEFLPEALQARADSLAVLREMLVATKRAEEEAERLKAERARTDAMAEWNRRA
jgi:hypothetical protein